MIAEPSTSFYGSSKSKQKITMLVKFLEKEVNAIDDWNMRYSITKDELLSEDRFYTVFGISTRNNFTNYDIIFGVDSYTKAFPSYLFEVIDSRLSRYFCSGKSLDGNNEEMSFISFKEWVGIENSLFYFKLVEGEEREVLLFEHYRKLLQLEFKHPDVQSEAILKEEFELECPICENVWREELPDFEMCKCNRCGTVLLNPLSGLNLGETVS